MLWTCAQSTQDTLQRGVLFVDARPQREHIAFKYSHTIAIRSAVCLRTVTLLHSCGAFFRYGVEPTEHSDTDN